MKTRFATAVAAIAIMAAGTASARDQIRIVGSSTVFPFSTQVAEQFGKTTSFSTPVVESTGSGGGIKLFCAGVGTDHPDIANSSRRMKAKEFTMCQDNGVNDIVEIKVGYDGIVIANAMSAPAFELTREEVYKALSAEVSQYGRNSENPFTMWNEINPSLPAQKIEVLGPPPTSGTRDAFEELALHKGAQAAGLDKKAAKAVQVRTDGVYVEAGENDNLIVSKLEANPVALGVFGFSFLDQNADRIKGAMVDGVEPTFENIASGDYPVARSLYFYVKKAHVGVIPGLEQFVGEFVSEDAIGDDGYTIDKGLIPLPVEDREATRVKIEDLAVMTGDEWS